MAKRYTEQFNGLVPINKIRVPVTQTVPPRPPIHAVYLNPLGINPTRSRVIDGMAHAMLPASSEPKNS